MSENETEVVVRAEFLGMSHDDIELNFQDNVLTLKGEKTKKSTEKGNYHREECCYGSFSRSFTLPVRVEPEKIRANFKDGILEIVLPKSEEAQPKKIAISAGS